MIQMAKPKSKGKLKPKPKIRTAFEAMQQMHDADDGVALSLLDGIGCSALGGLDGKYGKTFRTVIKIIQWVLKHHPKALYFVENVEFKAKKATTACCSAAQPTHHSKSGNWRQGDQGGAVTRCRRISP